MKTNDLKKGDMVLLLNGWKARIEDNKKGNTRLATVYGFETEIGSIYSHDIAYKLNTDGTKELIEYTDAQKKLRILMSAFSSY